MSILNDLLKNVYYVAQSKLTGKKRLAAFSSLTKLAWKKNKPGADTKEIETSFFNYKISAYGYPSLYYLYKEIFCTDDYFFKTKSAKPVIIDCGANIGLATVYFKKLFPTAQVIAFEANPFTYKMLEKNIAQNHFQDIQPHNIALYDQTTALSFFIDNVGSLRGSVRQDRVGKTEVMVKAEKLSFYVKQLPTIDLIKIDVEGAEINIINDLVENNLLYKPDQYIIEYHHNMDNERSQLSSFLKKFEDAGFNYSIKSNFLKVKSFQDILIHFYKP